MEFTDDWIDDENLYSETAREEQLNNGEISAAEEGFMDGYDHAFDRNFD